MERKKKEAFQVTHKGRAGGSPYVRAKHFQLVEKDHEAAIVWFGEAINAGDRVESALKDMAVVMNQQGRAEEVIEAIKSLRHLCPEPAQDSIDNILIDLCKKCGRIDDQIQLLKHKLRAVCLGEGAAKTARSHGKTYRVSIGRETARILGNLGWAYMQQGNYEAAEVVYRKAQVVKPDAHKACNLGLCLVRLGRFDEARRVLDHVVSGRLPGAAWDGGGKAASRAEGLMREMEEVRGEGGGGGDQVELEVMGMGEEEGMERLYVAVGEWAPFRSRRLPIFEEISGFRDPMAC